MDDDSLQKLIKLIESLEEDNRAFYKGNDEAGTRSEINYRKSKGRPGKCEEKYALRIKTPPDCILKSIYLDS